MTPAIVLLNKLKIRYDINHYEHPEGDLRHFGEHAAAALGQDPRQVFKTLLATLDADARRPVVALVPVAGQLDLKKLAAAYAARKAVMAEPAAAQRITGYVVGGISPLGQRQKLRTCIDESALEFEQIYVSAGKRGLQIAIAPADLQRLCEANIGGIAR